MKSIIKHAAILALCLGLGSTALAQLGVNNPNPDPSSVLDVQANNRGILIPRMTTGLRQAMAIGTPTPAQGLLVFDTDQNRIYFWDGSAWEAANPMEVDSTGSNEILRVNTEMTIGAGFSNAAAPNNGLLVQGYTGLGTTTVGSDRLTVDGTTNLLDDLSVSGEIDATEDISTSGDLDVTGTVTAGDYSIPTTSGTNSPVPSGGIIMWSGSTSSIPSGWALCDGSNGTPDLRDRFVIGAGNSYSVNATGGNATHTHSMSTAGEHNHGLSGNTAGITNYNPSGSYPNIYYAKDDSQGWSSDSYLETHTDGSQDEGNHAHMLYGNTGNNGSHSHTNTSSSHLPPYLALAYIMKL